MDVARQIRSLERFADVLPALVAGLDADDARRRGPGDAWSVLEIVSHLADEEIEDFRTRVETTLRDPSADWPPIDPEGVAVSRRYNEGELGDVVDRFVRERRASLAWLRSLAGARDGVDWDAAHEHPRGALRAGDVMASWVAHDQLHLRQIAKRLFEINQRDGEPYSTQYAGSW